MDLIKLAQQTRMEKMKDVKPLPVMGGLPTPSSSISRAMIIEKKPKAKVLKEYFEEFVREAIEEEENK